MPLGVAHSHHDRPADTGLDILSSNVGLGGVDHLLQFTLEGSVHRLDGYHVIGQPAVGGQFLGVGERMLGTVPAGHGEGDDVLRPDRIGCQDRHHGRVDPAREPQHNRTEPTLGQVVPQAKFDGLGKPGDLRLDRFQSRFGLIEIYHQKVLSEASGPCDDLAVRHDHTTAAVEDEFVVSPDLVDVNDRGFRPPCLAAEQLLPELRLTHLVRTGSHVDDNLRPPADQVVDGIFAVELSAERLGVPEIFADAQADRSAAHVQAPGLVARLEVARLIEHVVSWQQRLDMHVADFAVNQQRSDILQRPARVARCPANVTDQRCNPPAMIGQSLHALNTVGYEPLFSEQVTGRIAFDTQLTEHNQIDLPVPGLVDQRSHAGNVPADVAHDRVILGQCDAHAFDLPGSGNKIGSSRTRNANCNPPNRANAKHFCPARRTDARRVARPKVIAPAWISERAMWASPIIDQELQRGGPPCRR